MDAKSIMIQFNYKKPSPEEAKRISESVIDDNVSSKSKGSSNAYKTHYRKQSVQFLVAGLICAAIGAISIFAMISGANGPLSFLVGLSETLLGVLGVFLPLAGIALIVMGIVYFVKSSVSPSSSYPKSPEALFEMLFFDNIYFVDMSGSATKMESDLAKWDSFAHARLCKLVPEGLRITKEQFKNYCSLIDKTMKSAAESALSVKKMNSMSVIKSGMSIGINNIQELYHSVYEVDAVFTKSYSCYYNNFKGNATVIFQFNIKGVLVKREDYWYPYDLVPILTIQ